MYSIFLALIASICYNKYTDKSIYDIGDQGLTYGRGYVYALQYHIVWCTKYWVQILTGGIDEELKAILAQIAA